MSKIEDLATIFGDHVKVGWPAGSSGAQRVIMIVYEPGDEHIVRKNLHLFATAAKDPGYGWHDVDITSAFAAWLGSHRYRENYFEEPEMLTAGASERFTQYVGDEIAGVLNRPEHDEREIVGLIGAASLFGAASLSDVLARVDHAIRGRLVVFFPGKARDGRYRLLDARDGWDYHAVSIQLELGTHS
ncbi:MAG: hypothetical protein WBQ17_14325 [Rhizomicrobium sp.]